MVQTPKGDNSEMAQTLKSDSSAMVQRPKGDNSEMAQTLKSDNSAMVQTLINSGAAAGK